MIQKLLLIVVLALFSKKAICQTPLEIQQLLKKSVLNDQLILTNDGRFACYAETFYNAEKPIANTVTIKESFGTWKLTLRGLSIDRVLGFTSGGKYLVFTDTLEKNCYRAVELKTGVTRRMAGIKKMVIPRVGSGNEVFYQSIDNELVKKDLSNERTYKYGVSDNFRMIGISDIQVEYMSGSKLNRLELLDLKKNIRADIAKGGSFSNLIWRDDNQQLAFLDKENQDTRLILFDRKLNKAKVIVDGETIKRKFEKEIVGISKLDRKSRSIRILVKDFSIDVQPSLLKSNLTIWSYFDKKLQPTKPQNPMAGNDIREIVFNFDSGILFYANDGDDMILGEIGDTYYGRNTVTKKYFSKSGKDGRKQDLDGLPTGTEIYFEKVSLDNKYIIYFWNNNWYSYNLERQVSACLTDKLNTNWYAGYLTRSSDLNYEPSDNFPRPIGDHFFRIKDQNDLWLIDASNHIPPVCITAGFGKKHNIVFTNIGTGKGLREDIFLNGKLILSAIGERDRKRGFFSCDPLNPSIPEKLVYEDARFNDPIISADRRNCFVSKENIESPSNWFATKNLKQFTPISKISSWYKDLKAEMIIGPVMDESLVRGTLYMPKEFDSLKTYPVIVNYYEERTSEKNNYRFPDLTQADPNIPWFVSQGYLVLEVDIYFELGNTGKSALEFVNATVDELIKKKYIDSTRIGLAGHSFGGFETLYLITHSNRFKAAWAGAPYSDLISGQNTIGNFVPELGRTHIEKIQLRMGTTMWERPDLHISNSPVFEADKVTTPLLMMHNKNDSSVPYAQGMEFFLSMRRLGKPCWLLEYEDERHTLSLLENKKDYTIRVTQFFDHYLKNKFSPVWMLEGQKYRDTRFVPGYDLDSTGRSPGMGIISIEELNKIKKYSKVPFLEKLKKLSTLEN